MTSAYTVNRQRAERCRALLFQPWRSSALHPEAPFSDSRNHGGVGAHRSGQSVFMPGDHDGAYLRSLSEPSPHPLSPGRGARIRCEALPPLPTGEEGGEGATQQPVKLAPRVLRLNRRCGELSTRATDLVRRGRLIDRTGPGEASEANPGGANLRANCGTVFQLGERERTARTGKPSDVGADAVNKRHESIGRSAATITPGIFVAQGFVKAGALLQHHFVYSGAA